MCDEDKLKLPDELERNTIDENNNGVPDYIDELVGGGDAAQEYAQDVLDDMNVDTDGDGIPDSHDSLPGVDDSS